MFYIDLLLHIDNNLCNNALQQQQFISTMQTIPVIDTLIIKKLIDIFIGNVYKHIHDLCTSNIATALQAVVRNSFIFIDN